MAAGINDDQDQRHLDAAITERLHDAVMRLEAAEAVLQLSFLHAGDLGHSSRGSSRGRPIPLPSWPYPDNDAPTRSTPSTAKSQ